jgi:hypothetical protein
VPAVLVVAGRGGVGHGFEDEGATASDVTPGSAESVGLSADGVGAELEKRVVGRIDLEAPG